MGKHANTLGIVEEAQAVLSAHYPLTVLQGYIENSGTQYLAVSNALVDARKDGMIPWERIEDRLRRPRRVSMWNVLPAFAETARTAYRRQLWDSQPNYVEVWLEKDSLSGIFEDTREEYCAMLNVGRGYDGWDSIHNAAHRFGDGEGAHVLYVGDLDPSDEDMVRSQRERLAFFKCNPAIVKCALTADDVTTYNLPPDVTKVTDTRRAAFVAVNGDVSVELDALSVEVLRGRVVSVLENHMDLSQRWPTPKSVRRRTAFCCPKHCAR